MQRRLCFSRHETVYRLQLSSLFVAQNSAPAYCLLDYSVSSNNAVVLGAHISRVFSTWMVCDAPLAPSLPHQPHCQFLCLQVSSNLVFHPLSVVFSYPTMIQTLRYCLLGCLGYLGCLCVVFVCRQWGQRRRGQIGTCGFCQGICTRIGVVWINNMKMGNVCIHLLFIWVLSFLCLLNIF